METLKRHLRTIGHAAALLFGAWWLVATTAPMAPPRECFNGIGVPATLRVVLGGARTPIAEGQFPSCQGLDGLVTGAALTFTLNGAAKEAMGSGGCLRRETQAIEGVEGVALSGEPILIWRESLTAAEGRFVSPLLPSCEARWQLELSPELPPQSGRLISPLDAGSMGRWFVHRQMGTGAAELCDGGLAGKGAVACEDVFVVESITEVTP